MFSRHQAPNDVKTLIKALTCAHQTQFWVKYMDFEPKTGEKNEKSYLNNFIQHNITRILLKFIKIETYNIRIS